MFFSVGTVRKRGNRTSGNSNDVSRGLPRDWCVFGNSLAFYRKGTHLRSWPEERKPFGWTPKEERDNFLWDVTELHTQNKESWELFSKDVWLTPQLNWLDIAKLEQTHFQVTHSQWWYHLSAVYSRELIAVLCLMSWTFSSGTQGDRTTLMKKETLHTRSENSLLLLSNQLWPLQQLTLVKVTFVCDDHSLICSLSHDPCVKWCHYYRKWECALDQSIMQLYGHLLSQAVLPADSSVNLQVEWVLHRHLVECFFGVEAKVCAKPQGPRCGKQACQRPCGNCKSFRLEFSILLKTSSLKTYTEAKENSHVKHNTMLPNRHGVLLLAFKQIL